MNTLRQRLQQMRKRPFLRNVAAVASGTAASQAITAAFTPVVTRIYGPEAFGMLGVFMSLAGPAMAIAALTYPVAIVLPKSDEDALNLARLSMCVGLGMSVIATIVLIIFEAEILSFLNAKVLAALIYLIPVSMLTAVVGNIIRQWLIRKRAFVLTARLAVGQSLLVGVAKTGLGFVYPTAAALVITNILGGLLPVVALPFMRGARANTEQQASALDSRSSIWVLAKRHRDFPLLRAPQALIDATSHSLPILLLAAAFSAASVGAFSVALSVLALPVGLVGNAIAQVLYPRVAEAQHHGERVRPLLIKATLGLAVTGFIPFAAIVASGPFIFTFALGGDWYTAGIYAQWLAIWIFARYIRSPAVSAIPVLRLQKGFLIYEILSTTAKLLALYSGYVLHASDIVAIAFFSVTAAAGDAMFVLWTIRRSARFDFAEIRMPQTTSLENIRLEKTRRSRP